MKTSLDCIRDNLIEFYTNILNMIIYLNKYASSTQLNSSTNVVESLSGIGDYLESENVLPILDYLKAAGFLDYAVDHIKKDKITMTVSPIISTFLLQHYFDIYNVITNSDSEKIEKILLLQKMFAPLVTSSVTGSGGPHQQIDYQIYYFFVYDSDSDYKVIYSKIVPF